MTKPHSDAPGGDSVKAAWVFLVLFFLSPSAVSAYDSRFRSRTVNEIAEINTTLSGQILDFSGNHGCDRRMYSNALGEKRDLYVYLPPGYDGNTKFPAMLFLHGLGHDEKIFLQIVKKFDAAIRDRLAPPMVIISPDGSIGNRPSLVHTGSFYINSEAGRYGDYIIQDVWPFALANFAIRPEREAHVVCGASMGGFGAFHLAFQNRETFGHIVGIMPPLNLRYGDCHGKYLTPYDPNCFALRPVERRNEIIGQFYGVILIRSRRMLDPLVGRNNPDVTEFVSKNNPFEMMTALDIRPQEFNIFVGYGKKDEFNLAAEIESFLDEAKKRNITIDTLVLPNGRHNVATALEMFPTIAEWLQKHISPYTPDLYQPIGGVKYMEAKCLERRPRFPLIADLLHPSKR